MSVVDDVRKVVQDLVAPDLKAIDARLSGLERRFVDFEKHMDHRFEAVEKMAATRHETYISMFQKLENTMSLNHAAVLHALDIDRRLERLESRALPEAPSKAS